MLPISNDFEVENNNFFLNNDYLLTSVISIGIGKYFVGAKRLVIMNIIRRQISVEIVVIPLKSVEPWQVESIV